MEVSEQDWALLPEAEQWDVLELRAAPKGWVFPREGKRRFARCASCASRIKSEQENALPFSWLPHCPKCQMQAWDMDADDMQPSLNHPMVFLPERDLLQVTCVRCSYSWLMQPATSNENQKGGAV